MATALRPFARAASISPGVVDVLWLAIAAKFAWRARARHALVLRFRTRIIHRIPRQVSNAFTLLLHHEAAILTMVADHDASSVARRTVGVCFGAMFHCSVPV